MSLIKKHVMTEKKIAANRRNQEHSHAPVADELGARIRAALLHFGYNLQAEELAMRALGEDPGQFQELLERLWEEYKPVGISQEGLVIRLARALWLMNRADRMQEGYAVRQATAVSSGREDHAHAQMMRLKHTEDRLRRLAQSVAQDDYVTTPHDLEMMRTLHQEGVAKEMGEIALALFLELQGPPRQEGSVNSMEEARLMVAQAKEIFGIGMNAPFAPPVSGAPAGGQPAESPQGDGATVASLAPEFSPAPGNVAPTFGACPELAEGSAYAELKFSATPSPANLPAKSGQVPVGVTQVEKNRQRYSGITPAEWEARERPRQLLENILRRQVETCEAQRKAAREEARRGPSPYERAAEIAPTHPNARLMRGMQDSNFQEVQRVTNLLLRMKRCDRQKEALEKPPACQDVPESKEVSV
jgi:hypothetical protein